MPIICQKCGDENADESTSCNACGHPQTHETTNIGTKSLNLAIAGIYLYLVTSVIFFVWSLSLALVGFCVATVFVTISTIVYGHFALCRTKKSSPALDRTAAIKGIIGYFLTFLLLMFVFYSYIAENSSKKHIGHIGLTCQSNLHDIGKGCILYASDNGNKFPDKLSRLYLKPIRYVDNYHTFYCSDFKERNEHFAEPQVIDSESSYIYIPGLKSTDDPKKILAYEKAEKHEHKGINILHVDGSVSFEEK